MLKWKGVKLANLKREEPIWYVGGVTYALHSEEASALLVGDWQESGTVLRFSVMRSLGGGWRDLLLCFGYGPDGGCQCFGCAVRVVLLEMV